METYTARIRTGSRENETASVQAATVEQAATLAAREFYGPRVFAQRVTGDRGKSGVFQSFKQIGKEGGATSVGENFHVG